MTLEHPERALNRVVVYGLGSSGMAAVGLLRSRGVAVIGVDRRRREEIDLSGLASGPAGPAGDSGVELALGGDPANLPAEIDAVVVSPGVSLDRPLLAEARDRGVPILAEVELAFPLLNGPVVGVTGSNGKSTTTAMTGALLQAAGFAVEVCGNIGVPLASVVDGPGGRIFVVELSSFQLETVATFRPRAAALLNISPDHLDRHKSMAGYRAAKANIFARQAREDCAVLNADDPLVRDVGTRARKRFFSRLRKVEDGCYLDGDRVVEVDPVGGATELFKRTDVAQQGEHNLENAMAAALLARAMGAAPAGFSAALAQFEGLPHRMETVALLDDVRWIDDSKGTNVGAVLKSLGSLPDGSVHVILGGRGKGESFEPLVELVARKARRVYLIGEATSELRRVLDGAARLEEAGDLERAVARVAREATGGETVLLSPACTSFDQYPNFAARGDHFKRLVLALVAGGADPNAGSSCDADGASHG